MIIRCHVFILFVHDEAYALLLHEGKPRSRLKHFKTLHSSLAMFRKYKSFTGGLFVASLLIIVA